MTDVEVRTLLEALELRMEAKLRKESKSFAYAQVAFVALRHLPLEEQVIFVEEFARLLKEMDSAHAGMVDPVEKR